MTVAQTILNQLGGQKFIAMTGSRNFTSDGNTLGMRLARNRSKANILRITLNAMDTYDMEFLQHIRAKVKIDSTNKAVDYTSEKLVTVKSINGVYFDQLKEIFSGVTGLVTYL